jgi:Mrp family chromosome partitioning ATPase
VATCTPGIQAGPSAIVFARQLAAGSRVVLIDLDCSTGDTGHGLGELMAGDITFDEAIYRDDQSRLHLIDRGLHPVMLDEGFSLVMEVLQKTYDFIVLVAGKSTAPSTRHLAAQAGSVLLVTDEHPGAEDVARETAIMKKAGAQDVFVIEVDPVSQDYYAA